MWLSVCLSWLHMQIAFFSKMFQTSCYMQHWRGRRTCHESSTADPTNNRLSEHSVSDLPKTTGWQRSGAASLNIWHHIAVRENRTLLGRSGKYNRNAFGRIWHYFGVRENMTLLRRSGEYDTTLAFGRIGHYVAFREDKTLHHRSGK